jgi:hypothetical protein
MYPYGIGFYDSIYRLKDWVDAHINYLDNHEYFKYNKN